MNTEENDLIISILNEIKEDMKSLRESNHNINDELHKVANTNQLIRQQMETQKEDTKERFTRVHTRIDKEQEVNEQVRKTVNEIAPKVNRISTVMDWISRLVVTSMVAGVLWAVVQMNLEV